MFQTNTAGNGWKGNLSQLGSQLALTQVHLKASYDDYYNHHTVQYFHSIMAKTL